VTSGLRAAGVRRLLLDIEGTTTPIAFVHEVLFPFARARVRGWLEARPWTAPEVIEIADGLRRELEAERGAPAAGPWDLDAVVARVHALMDRDRKSTPLKLLQGRIWEEGYASGALKGEVYPDVPEALARWASAGIRTGIFSSGSVLAQQLLFRHSTAGDLTPLLSGHFDTAVGAKTDRASYRRIVDRLDAAAPEVLFVSDVTGELDAARDEGLQTRLCVRAPAPPPADGGHAVVTTFADLT
jgi:enolase-phosphatase E1